MAAMFDNYVPDAYQRVSRMTAYCLMLTGADAWHGLTVVLSARLTPEERAAMAWAVLRSLTPNQIMSVFDTVLPPKNSQPIAPLFSHMDEATFWAEMAEPVALEAYCLACFKAMPAPRQAAFLDFVQKAPALRERVAV